MANCGEIEISEFLRLMRDYVEGRIDARSYQTGIFALTTKRFNVHEEESRILQQAYGDADDYDPEVKLEYTIEEKALRERVKRSLAALITLGHAVGPEP